MTYTVRRVLASEWEAVRDLRLQALQDPVAHLAFLTSHAEEAAREDAFWQQRTMGAAEGGSAAQFVVVDESDDGRWVGSVTGLLEQAGASDFEGRDITERQVHVVGVWLHPAHRGQGLVQRALGAVADWARDRGATRARLYVHADNGRAQAAYEKAGFRATGNAFDGTIGREVELALPLT